MILGMHLLHLVIALGESIIMTAWIFLKGLDTKHARDVRVTAVYWYWVVGTWVPLYLIIFLGPRL
jgi:heme/copper-type cytochrome/quinol oxidase subunit 3